MVIYVRMLDLFFSFEKIDTPIHMLMKEECLCSEEEYIHKEEKNVLVTSLKKCKTIKIY